MDDSRFSRARSCVQWRIIACAFFSLLVGTAANLVRPSYQGLILDSVIAGAKNAFLSHFILNAIILSRQARDKHRERTQKRPDFLSGDEPGFEDAIQVGSLSALVRLCALKRLDSNKHAANLNLYS
jgi:uncharacterized membrane protein YeaQ/YmgE (transglycosylase-associated protein family)